MAKKKERREKARTPQTQTLEELLRAGEAALYGQVCWSIANRGTDRPRPGEVITLDGGAEVGGHANEKFRLTRRSIENIEQCMGMRTCGEAIALFVEEREAEPWGECPLGHQEAALAFMMYGIRPTEPCPECGEIPKFGSTAMSPSFYSGGPVKGVDGQVYTTCPECGEDALQLEGDSPAEWGWNITCLNCGWEMKQAESLDIAQYCDLMEEVKSKVESINQLMEMPGVTIRTRVESICLQLRIAAGADRLQFAGFQQGRLAEVAKGTPELPGHKQEAQGTQAPPSEFLSEAGRPTGKRLRGEARGSDRGIPN